MLTRVILAIIVAVVVGIVLTALFGPILVDLKVPIARTFGEFFVNYGFAIGVLVGLWYFLTGGTFISFTRTP